MTEIPECPFDKIAIDLVTECKTSSSGNRHILTIIDDLTGWPEAFPIPDKSADTIVSTFIKQYLPIHMCPRYILSDNGTYFKNQLMDKVLQQFGIETNILCTIPPTEQWKIGSCPQIPKTHPEETLWKGPIKLGHVYKSGSIQLQSDTKPCYGRNTILLGLWERPQLTSTPASRAYAKIPRRCSLWIAQCGSNCLALVIAKKTLDENCFRTAHKTTNREAPSHNIGDKSLLQEQTARKMGLEMEAWISNCPYWAQWTLHSHWKSGNWKNKIMQCQGHSIGTTSRTMEHWHAIWQSREIHQLPCKLANY